MGELVLLKSRVCRKSAFVPPNEPKPVKLSLLKEREKTTGQGRSDPERRNREVTQQRRTPETVNAAALNSVATSW